MRNIDWNIECQAFPPNFRNYQLTLTFTKFANFPIYLQKNLISVLIVTRNHKDWKIMFDLTLSLSWANFHKYLVLINLVTCLCILLESLLHYFMSTSLKLLIVKHLFRYREELKRLNFKRFVSKLSKFMIQRQTNLTVRIFLMRWYLVHYFRTKKFKD